MALAKLNLIRAYQRLGRWKLPVFVSSGVIVGLACLGALGAHKEAPTPPPAAAAPPTAPLWTTECAKKPDGGSVCYVQQFAISQQQHAIVLHVQIGYLGGDDKPRILITAPLGVALPPGIGLTLDGDKPLVLPFETCQQEGCASFAVLDKDVLNRFLKGKQLVVRYVDASRSGVDVPVRLEGLDSAFKSLQKNAP
jgi:invasion protein IalB